MGEVTDYFSNEGVDGVISDPNYPMFDYYLKNDDDILSLEEKITKQLIPFIIEKFKLENAKKEKLQQIDADFENITKQGWDSGQGFNLGITAQDVSLLVGLFVLAKEASAMGLNPPPVIDMNGGIHTFTMQELTMLMLQYGQARSQISATDATRRKAVENATTIEEVNNI